MGAEISQSYRGQNGESQQAAYASWMSNRPPDWTQVTSYPVDKWKPALASMWGFDYYDEWRARKFKVHKRPWSKFSVTAKNYLGKEEKVCSFNCKVYETGREERLSGWMKDFRVLAFHPKVIIVQVCLSKYIKLLVVDWQTDHLLGTYSFGFNKEPCFQECFVSPDASLMLCRQDFLFRRKLHHVTSFDPNIRVIEIKEGLCRRLFVIEDRLAMNVFGSGLAMDPRLPTGRVAVFACASQATSLNQDRDGLQIYDLKQRRLAVSALSDIDKAVHHIQYSPDGTLIAALCVNVSIFISCSISIHSIRLYNSNNLSVIHTICMPCEASRLQQISMYPMFSRNGSLLAQIGGDVASRSVVQLYQLPCHYNCLQEICRSVIRKYTPRQDVSKLPLPKRLISYLNFVTDL